MNFDFFNQHCPSSYTDLSALTLRLNYCYHFRFSPPYFSSAFSFPALPLTTRALLPEESTFWAYGAFSILWLGN